VILVSEAEPRALRPDFASCFRSGPSHLWSDVDRDRIPPLVRHDTKLDWHRNLEELFLHCEY